MDEKKEKLKELIQELLEIKEEISALKQKETELKELLEAFLDELQEDTFTAEGVGKVERRRYQQTRFSVTDFRHEHPDLYQKYLQTTNVTSIRIYGWEDEEEEKL